MSKKHKQPRLSSTDPAIEKAFKELEQKANAEIEKQRRHALDTAAAGREMAQQHAKEKSELRRQNKALDGHAGQVSGKLERYRQSLDEALFRVRENGSPQRRVAVDWGSGLLATGLYQASSTLLRRWVGPGPGQTPKNILSRNSNWLFDASLAAAGVAGYWIEMGTRPKVSKDKAGNVIKSDPVHDEGGKLIKEGQALPYLPTEVRELMSEGAKDIGLIAFNRAVGVLVDYWRSGWDPAVLAAQN